VLVSLNKLTRLFTLCHSLYIDFCNEQTCRKNPYYIEIVLTYLIILTYFISVCLYNNEQVII